MDGSKPLGKSHLNLVNWLNYAIWTNNPMKSKPIPSELGNLSLLYTGENPNILKVMFGLTEGKEMEWNLIPEGMGFPYSTFPSGIRNPYLQLFLIFFDTKGTFRKIKTNIRYGFDEFYSHIWVKKNWIKRLLIDLLGTLMLVSGRETSFPAWNILSERSALHRAFMVFVFSYSCLVSL